MLRLEMLSWGSVDEKVTEIPSLDDDTFDETDVEEKPVPKPKVVRKKKTKPRVTKKTKTRITTKPKVITRKPKVITRKPKVTTEKPFRKPIVWKGPKIDLSDRSVVKVPKVPTVS